MIVTPGRSGCPIASTLDSVGDRWTMVLVRYMLTSKARYTEFLTSPARITTNVNQDFHEALRFRTCFGIPVEMNDIIEIPWARPFRERSECFRERLDVIVGQDFNAIFRSIAVWMENLRADWRQNNPLVGG